MKDYTLNDILDLRLKYKDNEEILDLINFIEVEILEPVVEIE